MLVNGIQTDSISIEDRGLLYGDGVFRTMCFSGGRLRHWQRHLGKLASDCAALGIPFPSIHQLEDELAQLLRGHAEGVVKLIITRGVGLRGYAPALSSHPGRIFSIAPMPHYAKPYGVDGIHLAVCKLRLARQPALAGIKHLNRLENVLAAAELQGMNAAEGLLLDEQGEVIEGTRSNLFMVLNGELHTPDLSRCGVAGVQRERVLDWAAANAIRVNIRAITLSELTQADELFMTNSVIGLWPVRSLLERVWTDFPLARQIQQALEEGND
ncbi:MAG: aminodeoxychorismate lyase [Nitrosomonadales bacterium]|nr:aminodeoxychorismate lyase [Nitrosomonadales bacterium]